jgi:hypothetical protein
MMLRNFEGKSMITCDQCGEAKDCLQKEVEGKEYDICRERWNPLAQSSRERPIDSGNCFVAAERGQRTARRCKAAAGRAANNFGHSPRESGPLI